MLFFIEGLYIFGEVFLICEVGNHLNIKFETINKAFYDLDWNTFPDKIQRMMPPILHFSQEPVQLSAYGNYPCTRDMFKKVIKMCSMDEVQKALIWSLSLRLSTLDIHSSLFFEASNEFFIQKIDRSEFSDRTFRCGSCPNSDRDWKLFKILN